MVVEQLIFIVISFALFVFMFFKMIKNNDTTYIIFLVLQAIGIALCFIEVINSIQLNILVKIIMYVLGIVIPAIILLLEKAHFSVTEKLNIVKARFFFNLGNNKKAKQILINLIEKKPDSYKAHYLLAYIYESEGGIRKAIDEYVQAIDLNKQDYNSYYKVATLLTDLDKKDEASQMLTSLLSKKPDYKEASVLLSDLLVEKEMYKEAVNILHEALKFNPYDFDINYSLGIAYTMINDFKSAKEYYEKAANINSFVFNCKYALAEIALIYKELEEAEKLFMQTIDDDELAPDSYYELSKIYLIKGDKERAIQYANMAISLNPKKIVQKIKKENIFIPIYAKLTIPFNLDLSEEELEKDKNEKDNSDEQNQETENNEKPKKLSKKELKAKKHLEEMFDITRQIGYVDMTFFSSSSQSGKARKIEEQQENREIQE
ncbi:MAG: tetratricopeptide repeat protein [Clostridia bacterium]|nr:tetratricopeptide repeat protein [Clostridia bacterium]